MSDCLPGYDEALDAILPRVQPLAPVRCPLSEAAGRVLRDDLVADRDQPPFGRAAMDGYAVRADRFAAGRRYRVLGSVPAGARPPTFPVEQDGVLRIATGGSLPQGADAVVPLEHAEAEGRTHVRFPDGPLAAWQNVHRQGSDARAGEIVLRAGRRLGPQHVAVAATVGAAYLMVAPVPRVTLLTTGDEVRPPDTPGTELATHQIRNSNGPMLSAWCAVAGAPVVAWSHVRDESADVLAAARAALAACDLVLTVGGVSVGERDLLPSAWERLGLRTLVHGVAIQPGKPLLAAIHDDVLVLGLPGNPVSALTTAHLFVWPVLRRLSGQPARLPWRRATLAEAAQSRRRRELFRAARTSADGTVRLIAWHGSGDLLHTADGDAIVRLPRVEGMVAAGTRVDVLPLLGVEEGAHAGEGSP